MTSQEGYSQKAPQGEYGEKDMNIIGHLYQVGQRVYRRQNGSAMVNFGAPRTGTIVGLTWKEQRNGFYPSYAVKFDNSSVIDQSVLQMRLNPLNK